MSKSTNMYQPTRLTKRPRIAERRKPQVLRNKDFYVGLIIGALLLYVYQNHIKKGPGA